MDLAAELARQTRFGRLVQKVSCDSTQALALADTGPDPAVFWAEHQTAGRGRQGRSWDDDAGQDIAVTFKVPDLQLAQPTQLAAAVPLAMLRALSPTLPGLRIKWPNDLLHEGRKLCGILIDTSAGPGQAYLIGIGVNVNRRSFPRELEGQATSLQLASGRELAREGVLLSMACQLHTVLGELEAGMAGALGEEFARGLGLVGQEIEVHQGEARERGRLARIDLDEAWLEDGRRFLLAHVQQLISCE